MGSDSHPRVRTSFVSWPCKPALSRYGTPRFLLMIFALLVVSPAVASDVHPADGGLNGWVVFLLIVLVLAAGLYLQSTTRRIQ